MLLNEARRRRINLSATLEALLRDQTQASRQKEWLDKNRSALDAPMNLLPFMEFEAIVSGNSDVTGL